MCDRVCTTSRECPRRRRRMSEGESEGKERERGQLGRSGVERTDVVVPGLARDFGELERTVWLLNETVRAASTSQPRSWSGKDALLLPT